MKKIFSFVLFLAFSGYCAIGDILGVTIDSTGYFASVTISAIDTGGMYSTGIDTPACSPINAKLVFTVTSMGYDSTGTATTRQRIIYGTWPKYSKGVNASKFDWSKSGSDAVIPVALSEEVYAKDEAGAGNSGVDITYALAKGLYRKNTDTSKASTGTATNNSTLSYPKVIANWSIPAYQRFVGSTAKLKAVAFHKHGMNFQQVAAARFYVADQNTHTDSVTVIRQIIETPSDSIAVIEYVGNVPMATMVQGDSLSCNFKIFPFIGDTGAVIWSGDGALVAPNYAMLPALCDKNGTYGTTCACVDSVNGVDATGKAKDTTAIFATVDSCYKTISAAANAIAAYNNTNRTRNDVGGGIIYLKGPAAWAGGTVTTTVKPRTYLTITAYPGVSRTNAGIFKWVGSKTIADRVKFKGVNIAIGDASVSNFVGTTRLHLWIDSCRISSNQTVLFYQKIIAYLTRDSIGAITAGLKPYTSTDNFSLALVRSCVLPVGMSVYSNVFIGNRSSGAVSLILAQFGANPIIKGPITAYNKAMERINSTSFYSLFNAGDTVISPVYGAAIVQNVIENKTEPGTPVVKIAADASTLGPINNVIFEYNTIAGARSNLAYNDYQNNGATPKIRTKWSIANNIFDDINVVTSGDIHGSLVDSTGYGNYSVIHGAGLSGNLFCERVGAAGGYVPKFIGVNSYSRVASPVTPLYTLDGSAAGTATGNGNYRLKSASSGINIVTAKKSLPYDISGVARRDLGAAGAYESLDTLARFFGAKISTCSTIAVKCSTLAKVSGDSIKIYLQTKITGAWVNRDSSAWITTATYDTLTALGLSDTTKYFLRLYSITTSKYNHIDTLSVDSAYTLSIAVIDTNPIPSCTVTVLTRGPTQTSTKYTPITPVVHIWAGGAPDSIRCRTALPAGLTANASTGTISGTPADTTAGMIGLRIVAYGCADSSVVWDSLRVTNRPTTISPSIADTAGAKTLTIRGSGFGATPTVTVVGTAPQSYTSRNDTSIVIVMAAHASGTGNVVVTNGGFVQSIVNGFRWVNSITSRGINRFLNSFGFGF